MSVDKDLTYTLICDDGAKFYYKPHVSSLKDEEGKDL